MITHIRRSGLDLTQRFPDDVHIDAAYSASDIVCKTKDATLECGYWDFAGDQRVTPSDREYFEIFVILEGEGVYMCDGEICRVAPGDILMVEGPTGEQRMWSTNLRTAYFVREKADASGQASAE